MTDVERDAIAPTAGGALAADAHARGRLPAREAGCLRGQSQTAAPARRS